MMMPREIWRRIQAILVRAYTDIWFEQMKNFFTGVVFLVGLVMVSFWLSELISELLSLDEEFGFLVFTAFLLVGGAILTRRSDD